MAQATTPPWAKRLESKIDKLLGNEQMCARHKKYGAAVKKQCDPPCSFVRQQKEKSESLSPVVQSILDYMKKPMKCLSPIKDLRLLEDDIQPITFEKMN